MRHSVLILCVNISLDMKLFIVLSVIACGYAAKLDRTYLPPASAGTAGGSPGSLTAPFGSSSTSNQGFGQAPAFGSSSGPSGFDQPQSSGFGKTSSNFGQSSFGQGGNTLSQPARPSNQYGSPSSSAGFSQSGASAPGFGPSANAIGSSAPGFGTSNFGQSQDSAAQPQRAQAEADRNAEILRYENENDGNTFAYSFETSNGISAEESGVATNGVQAQGGFSYTGDDGEVYRVTYTADENGYVPQGDHLPTSPPIPDEILRSIEENARAAAAGTQEGAYQPEDNGSGNTPQQYSGSSPSYNQGTSGLSFNQPQGSANAPSQQYGSPNAASGPSGSFGTAQGPSGTRNQFAGSSFNQGSSGPVSSQASSLFGAAPASGRGSTTSQFGSQNNAGSFGPTRPSSNSAQNSPQVNGYQYNRPQVPNGPFSASRQDQSSAPSRPSQQYGTPATSGRGSNQGPSQQYGAPIAPGHGFSQGPQGSQFNAPTQSTNGSPQGSSQFNAPSASGRGPAQGPSQQYGAPVTSGPGSAQGPSQQYNTPSTSFRQSTQGPLQQYGALNVGRGSNQGTQFGAAPSGQAGYTGSFSASRQDQSPAQSRPQSTTGGGSQGQDDNGYQYNRPQGASFGQEPSSLRPQSPGQFGKQSPASQFNQPTQSAFARPSSVPSHGSSGPSFGTGPTNGPAAALASQSFLPGSRSPSQTVGSRPTQSSFVPLSGQQKPGQLSPGSMIESNQYQSGSPNQGTRPNQSSFSPAAPTFGGPRQPPSFSPENGYVY